MRFLLPSAALLIGLAGCSTLQENAGACPVPPAPKREDIPKPPVSETEQIWQPGFWEYSNGNYSWRPGSWIKRDGRGNQWMDGYWDRASVPGPCKWNPPHWM